MKIGFIGVGKLGKECAEVIADKGYYVEGFDVAPRAPKNFQMVDSVEKVVNEKDIIFVAIPTGHHHSYGGETPTSTLPPKDFDYSVVKSVLETVNKFVNKSQLVVLISTVLPGTTRREFAHLITNGRFIYNPYLIAMGSVAWDMVNPEMVIIGTENGSTTNEATELIEFYKTIMENSPRYEIGTWEEAESIKIFYNTFISAKIGLVNMIQDVAESLGNMNVDIVTQALAKSTQRITGPKYMVAGCPDGGACHPRDNIALRSLSERLDLGYDLFGIIMEAREKQTEKIAKKAIKEAGNMPIIIVGKAYKPGVAYLEGSGSLLVDFYIKQAGKTAYFLDKYTNDMPPRHILEQPCLYLLMHDSDITYCDSPLKESIKGQLFNPVTGSVIIDMWRKQDTVAGCTVLHYGNPGIKL